MNHIFLKDILAAILNLLNKNDVTSHNLLGVTLQNIHKDPTGQYDISRRIS